MNTDKMLSINLLEDFKTQVKNNFDTLFNTPKSLPSVFLNGTNAYISVANNADINFGTGTFTVICEYIFENGNTIRHKLLKTMAAEGYVIRHDVANKVSISTRDSTNAWSIVSTNPIVDGKFHVIGFVKGIDSASSKLYIDGIEDVTAVKSGTFPTGTTTNTYPLYLGSWNTAFYKTETRLNRLFNYGLTASQIQKCSYEDLAYEDVGGSNTLLTSGNIIIGKRYKVISAGTGIVINGTTQTVNSEIIATSSTVTWNSGSVIQIGCVLNLTPDTINPLKWNCKNGLYYADLINGEAINLPINHNANVVYKGITGNSTVVVPKGYAIEMIYIKNTTANAITGGIKLGTTSGGTDVLNALAVAGSFNNVVENSSVVLKKFFSDTANTTLYLQAVSSWNNASLNFALILRRVV